MSKHYQSYATLNRKLSPQSRLSFSTSIGLPSQSPLRPDLTSSGPSYLLSSACTPQRFKKLLYQTEGSANEFSKAIINFIQIFANHLSTPPLSTLRSSPSPSPRLPLHSRDFYSPSPTTPPLSTLRSSPSPSPRLPLHSRDFYSPSPTTPPFEEMGPEPISTPKTNQAGEVVLDLDKE
ncbi:hypothetical protein JCM3765_007174 [Sporobolomyces pararoseus]